MIFLYVLVLFFMVASAIDGTEVVSSKSANDGRGQLTAQNISYQLNMSTFPAHMTFRQYGTGGIPFSTSTAYALHQDGANSIVEEYIKLGSLMPWSATGKLEWSSGNSCTAALIGPHIAVTSASCVCAFGSNTLYEGTATFISLHSKSQFLIKALVEDIYPAIPYLEGNDICASPGQACENDIALLKLGSVFAPALNPLVGKSPGEVAGFYKYATGNYSFVNYGDYMATQVTALCYAQNFDSGDRMIRTDSVGIQTPPNQLKIGSDMAAETKGCPFLINFGSLQYTNASTEVGIGIGNEANAVIGISSFSPAPAGSLVITGSRFDKNSKYPEETNIQTLVNTLCCKLSETSRIEQCGPIFQCSKTDFHEPSTTDWRLGSSGDTCDRTCGKQGMTCNDTPMKSVRTLEQALQVSLSCGVDASGLEGLGDPYADSPAIWNGMLLYKGTESLCNAYYGGSQRLCCCGDNCPANGASSPPATGTVPGQPSNLEQLGNSQNSISISWKDGSIGSPSETYEVRCMMYGDGCDAIPERSVGGIQRGTQTAAIEGLLASTLYSCFVVALNSLGETCSDPLTVSYQNRGSCTARDLLEANQTKPKDAICGTPNPTPDQVAANLEKQKATFGATASSFSTNNSIFSSAATFSATVPVYIYTCENIPTISSEQLDNQINVLNADYASTGIQFSIIEVLTCSGSQKTEWMNQLGGNKEVNSGFNYLRFLAKSLNKDGLLVCLGDWDAGILGIAELGLATNPVNFNQPGTLPGGSYSAYNLGRTMTHEIGHNLGLYHVFDQGCEGEGDYISDTPKGRANYGCPLNSNTCSSPGMDAINNFMEYTNDCCMTVFSPRQRLAMQAEITQSKPQWLN